MKGALLFGVIIGYGRVRPDHHSATFAGADMFVRRLWRYRRTRPGAAGGD
jgi:hypothetical protein